MSLASASTGSILYLMRGRRLAGWQVPLLNDRTTHSLCTLVLTHQAQAPKLKATVLEIEEALKQKYEDATTGDYTLWATGPEDALEMLRVRRQSPAGTTQTRPSHAD